VKAERVHGLREYMEELLPILWALLFSGVAGTVNLSDKLGELSRARRSFSKSEELEHVRGAPDLRMHGLHAGACS
jgi:hypothetical protein